ncbi:MAG: peroxiredoxin family protein [Thermodesulfobacteriota bacterium]
MRYRTKAVFILAFLFFVTGGLASGADPFTELGVTSPRVRVEAPAFTLKDLSGNTASLEDFKGKIVLLNFWATWCRPCRQEMPSFERLAGEFGEKGLAVVGVAGDRGIFSKKKVGEFIRKYGLTFTVLMDPDGEVRKGYEVSSLPTTYIIGRDGKISGRIIGDRPWEGEASKRFLEGLLKE